MTSETEVTLTNALEKVVGPTFVTLSYAASRVRRLMRPELGCDLRLYAGVLGQYEVSVSGQYQGLTSCYRCCSPCGTLTPC